MPNVLRKGSPNPVNLFKKGRTPVSLPVIVPYLGRYPWREAAGFLADGFAHGSRIPCSGPVALSPWPRNLKSTRQNPQVVSDKLAKEVELRRMSGPFNHPPIPSLHVSPLGVVPKKEPNKFWLIQHLSYPKGASVNNAISPDLALLSYTSFDAADIESALRLLPVHLESQHLLGCFWDGQFFLDRCLPMGCSISCAYYEVFSTLVE